MKFTDGAWLWADGVSPTHVRRISDYRINGSTLWLAAPDRSGSGGIDRVEGQVLQLTVTSPMPDVIRVQIRHHHPKESGVRGFDLDYSLQAKGVKIEDKKDHLLFSSGNLSLRFKKSSWEMQFERADGEPIVPTARENVSYLQVKDKGNFLCQRFGLNVGECIYGMGERFGPLVKNGQTVTIWNEDGGTTSDQAYKSVPFYLSSAGYGVLVNTPGKVEFEIATERVSQVQFSVQQEELDYYFFHGPNPKDVLGKYTKLAGRPAVPPAWSFGLWLSTSFTTHYNEKTVNEFVDGMFKRGIPLSVMHFDCFWMKERQWCDFEWDRDAFPDPAGMLKRLKKKGLRVCVWINTYISQLSPLFAEGRDKGYFLKSKTGDVYQRTQWQPGMAFVDFTNPAAVKWYQSKLRNLLKMGVDCFKTDFGERIPDDAVYFDGSDPKLMHNYYTYLYNKAVFELLEDYHGKGNAIVFARSATTGGQKFPVHWGGDCEASWESMAEDLRGGISFCLSGAAFWSHDIGGFMGKANPSIYKRWVAFGLLSTHSRLHGNESYRVPWIFDDEAVDVMRHFVKLKNTLFPYFFATAHDANEHGAPMMRQMILEFPDDPAVRYLDRQYMLGCSMLVAPVFRQDDIAEYYLPPGNWTNLIDFKIVKGGQWHRHKINFMQMPVFARPNSMIPMSTNDQSPSWKTSDDLILHLFEIADGSDLPRRVVASDDHSVATIHLKRKGDTITLVSKGGLKNVKVIFHDSRLRIDKISNGKSEGEQIHWTDPKQPLRLKLK